MIVVRPSIHCIWPQLQGKSIMISTSIFAPIVSAPNKKRLLLLFGEIVVKQLLLMTRIIISFAKFYLVFISFCGLLGGLIRVPTIVMHGIP